MALSARRPEALLGWMGALSDPTRIRLLLLLERRELGVAELCAILQMPQSTVSRHLKVLLEQGWVLGRAQATNRLYRLGPQAREGMGRRLWLLAREEAAQWPATRHDALRLARRLEPSRRDAQAFFAGAAGRWDRLRAELYGSSFETLALVSLLPPEWTVADLGCGTGQAAAALAPFVRSVIGIDQSAAMLRAAARRTSALANVELRQGSLEALPLVDASVDAALLLLALTYVADPTQAAAEVCRVVRPGGRVVIVDLLRHDRDDFRRRMGQESLGFEAEELRGVLDGAGFIETAARPLAPEPAAKGPALLLATARRGGVLVEFSRRGSPERTEGEVKR
jgi:ArsR family transcriptional regulator